jgi:predicted HAD superfamily Cof-like phosphohydrolase
MKNGRVEPKTVAKVEPRDCWSYFESVWQWHRYANQPIGASFDDANETDADLGAKLVVEEFAELMQAYLAGDKVELADAAADLIWVTCGLMVRLGIDLDPVWTEVLISNHAKLGGPVREDGKLLKPEGWTPPDIAGALERGRGLTEDLCEVCGKSGADLFFVSATLIKCRGCGTTWGRCDGVWRLDPATLPTGKYRVVGEEPSR